ncbi:uncharacterized protein LOC126830554 [Patella vulgata]|uniref:uncharacterized protein LOC126830554 n=1 Tax=Patella vulgata TaxID=6465 RepID=UPI0024A8EEFA|nr:uncharacterized protein LOC126830554 [Patella vulgata]
MILLGSWTILWLLFASNRTLFNIAKNNWLVYQCWRNISATDSRLFSVNHGKSDGLSLYNNNTNPSSLFRFPGDHRIWSVNNSDVYCFVYVTKATNRWLLELIPKTWGSHCGHLEFICSYKFHENCTVPNGVIVQGKLVITRESDVIKKVFQYCYLHYLQKFKWFFRIKERAYVIMNNLIDILAYVDYLQPRYLGHRFLEGSSFDANASYVLSQSGLRSLVESSHMNNNVTEYGFRSEGEIVGDWLNKSGVEFVDTVDVYGRETFHSDDMRSLLGLRRTDTRSLHPYRDGVCCSDYTVTFLAPSVRTYWENDALVRQIRVFGYQKPSYLASRLNNTAVDSAPDIDDPMLTRTKNVKILCWILSMPKHFKIYKTVIDRTWAKRCDKFLVFVSNPVNKTANVIGLNITEGREHLTEKVYAAFKHCYDHYVDDYDWFLKADDDTFIIVENLRYFLAHQDPKLPVFFGYEFKPKWSQYSYMSGGSGYVLSKESLIKLVLIGITHPGVCPPKGGAEDVTIGHCLGNIGVKSGHTSDVFHKETFIPLGFRYRLTNTPPWFIEYSVQPVSKTNTFSSRYSISFHYTAGLYIDIYHTLLYGISPNKHNQVGTKQYFKPYQPNKT